jgi:hypothetical protein
MPIYNNLPVPGVITLGTNIPVGVYQLSAVDMPMNSHAKGAPHKFRGKYNDVAPFLKEYELLIKKFNILDSKDKCRYLQHFCS